MDNNFNQMIWDARNGDLFNFLLENYPNDYDIECGCLRPKNNHSISIRPGIPFYYEFDGGIHGNSLEYLVDVLGYNFKDAVFALNDGFTNNTPLTTNYQTDTAVTTNHQTDTNPEEGNPQFPEPCKGGYKRLFAFLLSRGISRETIQKLVDEEAVYQDEHGNVIFINTSDKWGEIRGTNTYADKRCEHRKKCERYCPIERQWCKHMDTCSEYKKDIYHKIVNGSKKNMYWIYIPDEGMDADIAYICEGAIDAISLYELHRIKGAPIGGMYVSIGGAGKQGAIVNLMNNWYLKKEDTILAVDNDGPGEDCRKRNPDLRFIIPKNKDWNDDLRELVVWG